TIKLIYFKPSPKSTIFWAIFIGFFLTFNTSGLLYIFYHFLKLQRSQPFLLPYIKSFSWYLGMR
ncbi:MAG: hypothetical protein V7K14_06635, partial [Nostoc sp.]|uniref:hypothetical protein n=1 Tax=Nostoc sp. TaxID=1180 RepID=UPI002FF71C8A